MAASIATLGENIIQWARPEGWMESPLSVRPFPSELTVLYCGIELAVGKF